MATVEIRGKAYYNVTDVKLENYKLTNGKEVIAVHLKTLDCGKNEILTVQLKLRKTRVSIQGNVSVANISNIAYVYGDIGTADVRNCLNVEGMIKDIPKDKSVKVDRDATLARHIERERNLIKTYGKGRKEERAQVIKVQGAINTFTGAVANAEFHVEIKGNIVYIKCGNCLYTKGNVGACNVGNRITMTAGMKPDYKKIKAEKERLAQYNKDMDDAINNLLKGFHFGV